MDSPDVANQYGIDSFATFPHPPSKKKGEGEQTN